MGGNGSDGNRLDGTLGSWDDLKSEHAWDALVLGNGMSVNVWEKFKYDSLYEKAEEDGLLSADDLALFEALGLTNFEQVLRKLSDAIVVGEAIGESCASKQALADSIQRALAAAVRAVHVPAGDIPVEALQDIREHVRAHRHVFTTSYDLLLYWASAHGPDPADPFEGMRDFFWSGGRNAFDEEQVRIRPENPMTRMYFLHGALHLVVLGDGTTCKRKRKTRDLKLLEQFGHPFDGDHAARPLVVTEADAADKLRSINDNDYLRYCWERLAEVDCPAVVFGHSLGETDTHLAEALNAHPRRPVAVSLLKEGRDAIRDHQLRIARLLKTTELCFFDAATHPLGAQELSVDAL